MAADPNRLKIAKQIGRPDIWMCAFRLPQTSRLLAGSSDFSLYDVDLAAEKIEPQPLAGHTSYVTGVAASGTIAVSGGWDGKLIWWNLETRQPIRTVDAHQRWIRGVELSPDGRHVASVGDDMVCRLWDVESGSLVHELRGHAEQTPNDYPSMLFACAFAPDGQHLATVDKTGHVILWQVADGTQAATLEAPELYTWDPKQRRHSIGGPRSLAFSPDGNLLAIGGMAHVGNVDHLEGKTRLELFDWRKGERTWEYTDDQFKGLMERLVWHPSGQWLLAAGGDHGGYMMAFDIAQKSALKREKAPTHIHSFVANEAFDTLYSVGYNKLIVWDMKAEEKPPAEASDKTDNPDSGKPNQESKPQEG